MRQLFNVDAENDHLGNAEPRSAIFPKGLGAVVRNTSDGDRELLEMRWGFLTPKVSEKTGKPLKPAAWNNARDDKLGIPLWRESFKSRRCLIPASSYNETQGEKPAIDHWFTLVDDDEVIERPPFAIAGMWRTEAQGLREDGESGLTYTMVTTEANELIKPIHAKGRMPVILDPDGYDTWLNGSPDQARALIQSYPSERMRVIRRGVGLKRDPEGEEPSPAPDSQLSLL